MKRTAVIISTPPYGNARGREALDMTLALSVNQTVSLFFVGNGVFHLRKNQSPDMILQRDYIATLGLLEIYDIHDCYACQEDMIASHITDPVLDVKIASRYEIADVLREQDAILRF